MSSIFWSESCVVKINPVGLTVSRNLNLVVEFVTNTLVVIGGLLPSRVSFLHPNHLSGHANAHVWCFDNDRMLTRRAVTS